MKLVGPADSGPLRHVRSLPETSSPHSGAFAESFTERRPRVPLRGLSHALRRPVGDLSGCARGGGRKCGANRRPSGRHSDGDVGRHGRSGTARVATATCDLDLAEAAARAVVPNVQVFCTLDTMDNVRKGGRIGAARAFLGSLLSIKPILEICDGVVRGESRPAHACPSLQYLARWLKRAGKLEALAVAHAAAEASIFWTLLAGVFPREDTPSTTSAR